MKKNNNKIEFLKNFLYNIIGSTIPLVLLQIIILPLISKYMGADEYGLAITIISLMNICPSVLGIALNNIRLLNHKENSKDASNFKRILLELLIINVIIIILMSMFYEKNNVNNIILNVILSIIWLLREYYIVEFQIKLNYKKILYNNIFLTIGYVLGYIMFLISKKWQIVYILGYAFALGHLLKHTSIWKEKNIQNSNTVNIRKDTYLLSFATLLIRITTYADRMILYPILGGTLVSIYYAASVIGKLISMIINPLSSVLLSYMSKVESRKKQLLNKFFIIVFIICSIGYCCILLMSRLALNILYPEFLTEAIAIVPYTALSTIIYVMISVLNPILLKFFEIKWQIILNGTNSLIYMILSITLLKIYGIIGFCYGIIISNLIKLLSMLLIYYRGKLKENILDES